MNVFQRMLVASVTAGVIFPATFAAQPGAVPTIVVSHRPHCARIYTRQMFDRAAARVYAGTAEPPRGSYGNLWRYAKCQKSPRAEAIARADWGRFLHARFLRRHPPQPPRPRLPYGAWAIPAPIVMCESSGQNLPPNSASASGYYQIISSTWAAYGGLAYSSAAYLAPKSDQDIVAERIWNQGGPSQWDCASMVSW
jgi:hypothetical protein